MPEVTAGLRERLEAALEECRTLVPEAQADVLLPVVGAVLQEQGAGLVEAEAELGTTSRARDSWYRKAQELRKRAEDAEAKVAKLEKRLEEYRDSRKRWMEAAFADRHTANEAANERDQLAKKVEALEACYDQVAADAMKHRFCREPETEAEWDDYHAGRDAWIAEHRFDEQTALKLAREAAPHVRVNRWTAADVLRDWQQREAS